MKIKLFVAMLIGLSVCVCNTNLLLSQEDAFQNRRSMFVEQVKAVKNEVGKASDRLRDVQQQIQDYVAILNEKSVSDIAYDDVYRRLQVHKVEITIELKGLDARMKLLEEKAAESSKAQSGVVDTKRELMLQYLHGQHKKFEQINRLHEKGAVPQQEVTAAKQLVIEAELKLKEFEMESKQVSPAYVEALFETSLAIAERKAKLEAVQEMLAMHVESRARMDELKQLMESRNTQKARLNEMVTALQKLETQQKVAELAARQKMALLELSVQQLKTVYGEGHPKVVAAMQELEILTKYSTGSKDGEDSAEKKSKQ